MTFGGRARARPWGGEGLVIDDRELPRTRWAWVEVDLEAIRHDVRVFRGLANPPTELMAVVKADAYGHGPCRWRGLPCRRADAFAVATVEEGVALRAAGVAEPILLLSQPHRGDQRAARPRHHALGVRPGVRRPARRGGVRQGQGARTTSAVDTGMDRIGVPWDGVIGFLRRRAPARHRARGTFSTTADKTRTGDSPCSPSALLTRFAPCARRASTRASCTARTPATVLHPATHYGMVRVGVAATACTPARRRGGA